MELMAQESLPDIGLLLKTCEYTIRCNQYQDTLQEMGLHYEHWDILSTIGIML